MTTRTASCACGKLSVTVTGDPFFVALCNCTQCQRRTGSAFGLVSFFKQAQLAAIRGDHSTFVRASDSGGSIEFHFCPGCGSSVFWYGDRSREDIRIAVGCFADAAFPQPSLAVWCEHKSSWVEFPPDVRRVIGQGR